MILDGASRAQQAAIDLWQMAVILTEQKPCSVLLNTAITLRIAMIIKHKTYVKTQIVVKEKQALANGIGCKAQNQSQGEFADQHKNNYKHASSATRKNTTG